jgi:hypothetical protein
MDADTPIVNRDIAKRIVEAIQDAPTSGIEYIPDAIGQRLRRHSESLVEVPAGVRRHERKSLLTSALAVRLTDRLQPFGHPFQVFLKDISASGLGFVHTRHWPECRMAIRIEQGLGQDICIFVVATVRRCVCKSGVYEVGVEFQHNFRSDRIDRLPPAEPQADQLVAVASEPLPEENSSGP